jgi:hypothetical protein
MHESMHVPFEQTWPAVQVTPAQGLLTQLPATQLWPIGQVTVAHGFDVGTQPAWHMVPVGHGARHGTMSWHWPSEGRQTWPCGQMTPLHGTWKHPGTHWPLTQLSLLGHLTPAQGSAVGMQLISHCEVGLQVTPELAGQLLLMH